MRRAAVVVGTQASVRDRLGVDWARAADAELAGGAKAGPLFALVGADVERIVLANRAVDGLGYVCSSASAPSAMYVCAPWRAGSEGRRVAVAAIQRVLGRLRDRREDPRRSARRWERDLGRAAGVAVTVLTDAPLFGGVDRSGVHSLAVGLKMLGVRVHGLPAPRTAWEAEFRRVLAARAR